MQAELDEAMPDVDTCLEYEAALELPLFGATIREVLRYYAAVPGPLPRYVPAGDGFIAEGKFLLPPGTQVALQSYTVHRNRDIYGDDADEFNPDRWLVSAGKLQPQWNATEKQSFVQRSAESADVMIKNVRAGAEKNVCTAKLRIFNRCLHSDSGVAAASATSLPGLPSLWLVHVSFAISKAAW